MSFELIVAAVAAAGAVARWWNRRRAHRGRVYEVAGRMGLRPTLTDPLLVLPFKRFSYNRQRGTQYVMEGELDGAQTFLFDAWRAADGPSGSNAGLVTFQGAGPLRTCAAVALSADCPHLLITDEHAGTRAASAFGFRDIEFESEGFNRRFFVMADDREFAFRFCSPGVMKVLQGMPARWEVEVWDQWFVIDAPRLDTAEWWTLLRVARDLRRAVPEAVGRAHPGLMETA